MHFDSFSLGARHLFHKLVLFFLCEVIPTCDTVLFSEWKSLSELPIKKKYVVPFEKKYFDSLPLKPMGLYSNLLGHPVVYQKPPNLVYR
jgi:hypothetical protein